MADYSDLYGAAVAAYVAAGYVEAPSGPDASRIPAHGAGTWVALSLDLTPDDTASNGTARETHTLLVSGIVARTAAPGTGYRAAQDLALALRAVLDLPTVLSSVPAHARPTGYTITELPSMYRVDVEFTVRMTATIA